MPTRQPPASGSCRRRTAALARASLALALGALPAVVLGACGSTGKGLIPAASAGPLQSDFEAVAQAAQSGEGSCSATEAAIAKTEQDYSALPATVNAGLRNTLHQGIANLSTRARALCAQPLARNTVTSSTPSTTTATTPTTSTPTDTQTATQPTTSTTTPTSPGPGGGTVAPGASEAESGQGSEPPATGVGRGGGTGAGADGAGVGESGQEGGK
jgi:hypothetical protein